MLTFFLCAVSDWGVAAVSKLAQLTILWDAASETSGGWLTGNTAPERMIMSHQLRPDSDSGDDGDMVGSDRDREHEAHTEADFQSRFKSRPELEGLIAQMNQ